MYFKDIIGLAEIKANLIHNAQTERIAHAQLFAGQEGSGVASLALAYARYINCHQPRMEDACGQCPSCQKYDRMAHPDLYFLFPYINGSKNSSDDFIPHWRDMLLKGAYFNRADWQELIKAGNSQPIIYSKESKMLDEKLAYKISEARYRVIYIWQPELMHEALANKLLKLVEEPPERTVILMASLNPNKVLGTILSRVQFTQVRPLAEQEILYGIDQQGLMSNATFEQKQNIAHLSKGNFREALDHIQGNTEATKNFLFINDVLRGIIKPDPKAMHKMAEQIANLDRESQIRLIIQMNSFFRECLIKPWEATWLNYLRYDQENLAEQLNGVFNTENIIPLMAECDLAIRHIRQNVNTKMVFFDLILRITSTLSPAYKALGLR